MRDITNPKPLIFPEKSLTLRPDQWPYQTRFTLILESAPSQSVNLHRLSDSDSEVVEVSLESPQVRNAIGKDMLKGLQNTFDAISNDSSANVLLIT
ncbi:hypothetical protein M0R45_032211 [Rubus argutus]|uniref:Enoyl-CoA hydratase/isomerase family protein n=1 Tax=Rubus argutus TaxID=59490 RepID=A0AAW1WIU1_RUBAR